MCICLSLPAALPQECYVIITHLFRVRPVEAISRLFLVYEPNILTVSILQLTVITISLRLQGRLLGFWALRQNPFEGKNGLTFLCQLKNDSKDVSTLTKMEQKKPFL